jgi:hypothetical protein
MYADMVTVVVRQTDDPYGGEVEDLVAHRFSPRESDFDPDAVSQEVRAEAMRRGLTRTTLDERRSYTDAGASGASVTFVLELLGSGATGVAMQELLNFIKTRISRNDHHDDGVGPAFRDTPTEDLRDYALSERALDLPRKVLTIEGVERDEHELRLRARSFHTKRLYKISRNADGSLRVQRLPDAT